MPGLKCTFNAKRPEFGDCIYIAEAYLSVPPAEALNLSNFELPIHNLRRERKRESEDAVRAQGFKLLIFFRLK